MEDNSDHLEDLRVEYQGCREGANGLSSSHWSFAGIFLGVSTAGFAFIIPNIFNPHNTGFKIFITFVSAGMLVIILMVHKMLTRMDIRYHSFLDRMREIELKRGMEAEIRQERIGRGGMIYWKILIATLSILWVLVIIFTWSY